MEGIWNNIETSLFQMTRGEAHKLGLCIKCKKKTDPKALHGLDKREYEISAFCPKCFDAVTNSDEDGPF